MSTIFITGSSSGLGRATAKLFASKGWKVIASMRDPKREKELGDISGITLMALDVTDPHEIESVAAQVVGSGGSMWCSTMLAMVLRVRLKGLPMSKFYAW
jgi:NAD(P)-dependent dehydrogenase (short-subunit alcohol dehydrogenase family)